MKDPAFLFYSTDFYEGTRTMLPEERACFIDLMIYQHQRGTIPNDLKRILLYCNGVNEATLKATLEAKFKLTPEGWVNSRLAQVILERKEYSEKQSINGVIGQFWKKSKAILSNKDYLKLRKSLENKSKDELFELVSNLEISEATLKALLEASLKHLEDEIEDEDKDEILIKGFKVSILDNFRESMLKWLHHKRKQGKTYKDSESTELAYKKLFELARGNPDTAMKIVEQSMANNWAGLFELKTSQKSQNNGNRHREVSCVVGGNQGSDTL